jgi:hypothetical protein
MISFKLYREYGALNSAPVFDAFQQGILNTGNSIVESNQDVSVIWSVLWNGRMKDNQLIYQQCRQLNKPILIIEVGNLLRGQTWRVGLNHINSRGFFANHNDIDPNRPAKLGVSLHNPSQRRKPEILIVGQHELSLQWENNPPIQQWAETLVRELRTYTDRPIVFRPHPRSRAVGTLIKGTIQDRPVKLINTYDNFNIDYNYHAVINFNSGPAIQSAIHGTPIICDSSSLAFPVSDQLQNIENPTLLDRTDWFLKLCHTEWTVDEISKGIPLARLLPEIQNQLKG